MRSDTDRFAVTDPRRRVPRTDVVLDDPRLVEAAGRLGSALVKAAVVEALDRCRAGEVAPDDVADAALASVPPTATALRRVVNASGVVVHTNLGRAPLSPAAVTALEVAADPWTTPERVALRRLARDFVAREIAPHVREWEDAGELPRDLHRRAAATGLLGVAFPEEVGEAARREGQGRGAVVDDVHPTRVRDRRG